MKDKYELKTELDVQAIAALRELDRKSTQGPWLQSAANGGWDCVRDGSHQGPIICGPGGLNNTANWELIAAMRNALPAVLDAAERCAFLERVAEQAVLLNGNQLRTLKFVHTGQTYETLQDSRGMDYEVSDYPDLATYLRERASDAGQETKV